MARVEPSQTGVEPCTGPEHPRKPRAARFRISSCRADNAARGPTIGGQLVQDIHAIDGDAHVRRPAGILTFAVTADLIARSPCAGVRLPRSTLVERPVLSAAQLQLLASELGPDQAAMMWLGVVGGLRWAECAGLQVASLDLLKGTVSVSAQLGRDGRLAAPKSRAGTRRLSSPGWLVNDLAAVLARRGLTAANPEEFVFVSPEGMPLNYTNWRRTWQLACKNAHLAGLRFHDLRSMAATALVAAGVDIKTAQARLGHSSPTVTLGIYARALCVLPHPFGVHASQLGPKSR